MKQYTYGQKLLSWHTHVVQYIVCKQNCYPLHKLFIPLSVFLSLSQSLSVELLSVLHRLMVTREASSIQISVLHLLRQIVMAALEHIREKRHSAEGEHWIHNRKLCLDINIMSCCNVIYVLKSFFPPKWMTVQQRRRHCQSLGKDGTRAVSFQGAHWCLER